MILSAAFLWSETKVSELLGVDFKGEAELIRCMVDTSVYLVISIIAVLIIVV
jgi:hypothetical protein